MNFKERVLVLGGAGYIGSVLTRHLIKLGYRVTVFDSLAFNQRVHGDLFAEENYHFVRGDVRDYESIKRHVSASDVVINLAAVVGAPASKIRAADTVSINLHAVENITKSLSKHQKLLIPTTNSGYGIGRPGELCTEESELSPLSLYGSTKVAAEHVVLSHGNGISLRLATVFGSSERMRRDLLVNDFVFRALNDNSLVIFEGHFRRNFIHIFDVCRAFVHGINNYERMCGNCYNVGLDDANLTKIQLAETIRAHIPSFTYVEAPIGEDPDKRDYLVSNEKIAKTGFEPIKSLDDGIHELIKCYRMYLNNQDTNL